MWADAFILQARSDWQLYEHLKRSNFPDCHALHYLQMATEKLAKAYVLVYAKDVDSVTSSHRALTGFLRNVSRNKQLQNEMEMGAKQLQAYVRKILPLAYEIENMAPALARGAPNPEYPWQDPQGSLQVPVNYDFPTNSALLRPAGHDFLKLVRIALVKFEALRK